MKKIAGKMRVSETSRIARRQRKESGLTTKKEDNGSSDSLISLPRETCVDVKVSKTGKETYGNRKVIQSTLRKSYTLPSRD